jgi:hypothetical protein
MARIRNIKPEFYSHEELNDLENNFSELRPMLVFSGLWNQCEFSGVFLWSPRKLKLAILPFVDFDIEKSLILLEKHGFISRFQNEEKVYGHVVNFAKYQAISGSEKSNGLKYPLPDDKNSQMLPKKLDDKTMTEPDQSDDKTMTADLGLRTKDLGQKTKDINSSGSAGEEISNPPKKSKNPKKPPLREREPENSMERVEKAYRENWDSLFSQGKVKTPDPIVNWNQARAQLKRHFEKLKPDQIIAALKKGMTDDFILRCGYSLGIMLSAEVLNRLINAKQGQEPPSALKGKKSLEGLDSW